MSSPAAERAYTKHGLRAHNRRPPRTGFPVDSRSSRTYCNKDAYDLEERSKLFRRRLRQAAMCYICEQMEESAQAFEAAGKAGDL